MLQMPKFKEFDRKKCEFIIHFFKYYKFYELCDFHIVRPLPSNVNQKHLNIFVSSRAITNVQDNLKTFNFKYFQKRNFELRI